MPETIVRFEHIRGLGSFANWTCEDDVPDFERFNIVYGWNGSGKSTLARLLRSFETGLPPADSDSEAFDFSIICSRGDRLGPGAIENPGLTMRVFTEDFVRENLRFEGGVSASPLLILGKTSVEAAARLVALGEELVFLQSEYTTASSELSRVESNLRKVLTDGATRIRELLRDGPDRQYYTYDKRNIEAALAVISSDAERPHIDAESERSRLNTKPKPDIELTRTFDPTGLRSIRRDAVALVTTELVDTAIAALRADPEVQDWVSHGLGLHENRNDRCLFCDQPMPSGRLEDLRRHFSDAYVNHIEAIDLLDVGLQQLADDLALYGERAGLIQLDRFYDDLASNWSDALKGLVTSSNALLDVIGQVRSGLRRKRSDPFAAVDDLVSDADVEVAVDGVGTALGVVDGLIESQRKRTSDLEAVRLSAQKNLEEHMVWEGRSAYLDAEEQVAEAREFARDLEEYIGEYRIATADLEAQASGSGHALSRLNSELEKYFGHGMFTVVSDDGDSSLGMALLRQGRPAHRLSEGERGGIALVYFLLKLEEDKTDIDETVVVIDDPVSSLDDGKAYQAYSLIYGATKGACQVFYLTHSFSMFRSLRKRLDCGRRGNSDCAMFMTDCKVGGSGPESSLRRVHSTLKKQDSEYHFLFVSLIRFATADEPDPSEVYSMPKRGIHLSAVG